MNLTIAGQTFDVPEAAIVIGEPKTEGEVQVLQQVRRENIRNNFAARVKKATEEGYTQEKHQELQAALTEYANGYAFGVRSAGGGTRIVDPVEREARRECGEVIKAAYFAKKGERLKGEALSEAVDKLMELKGDDYRTRARRTLRDRERAGEDLLAQTGLAA